MRKQSLETLEAEATGPEIASNYDDGPEETPGTPTDGPTDSTLDEMLDMVDDDKLDLIAQRIADRKRARAESLRNLADETVRIAEEMLEDAEQKADDLRAQADALDGGNTVLRPKAKRVEIGALIDELASIPIDDSPNPKRTRKPKPEKPAKPARKPKSEKPAKALKRGKRVMAPKTEKAPKQAKSPELDDHDQKILKAAAKGALGVAEIAEKCGLQQPYTARKCKKLVELGHLTAIGKNRSRRYEAA